MSIVDRIQQGRIVPVIALDKAEDAVPLCHALKAGGLTVAEITFRTKAAREAIAAVAKEFPEFTLGAGTVTMLDELKAAVDAGAGFAVAPGLNPKIVRAAQEAGLPFFPGIATPSEIEAALDLGCETVKFFPASSLGGVDYLKAIAAPYRHRNVRYIPTGGIEIENMTDYLAQPGVIAIGGSWIVKKDWINGHRWKDIEEATRRAISRGNEVPKRA